MFIRSKNPKMWIWSQWISDSIPAPFGWRKRLHQSLSTTILCSTSEKHCCSPLGPTKHCQQATDDTAHEDPLLGRDPCGWCSVLRDNIIITRRLQSRYLALYYTLCWLDLQRGRPANMYFLTPQMIWLCCQAWSILPRAMTSSYHMSTGPDNFGW